MTHATHAELVVEAQALLRKRDAVESEINEMNLLLKTHNIGMTEPLVDSEGFPRADVDVYTARNTRTSIIRLSNDHKRLTNELGAILQRVHEAARSEGVVEPSKNDSSDNSANELLQLQLVPFAKVQAVAPDSPSWTAGLRRDDLVLKFGSIHAGSDAPLKLLAGIVQASENRPLDVHIQRNGAPIVMALTPQKWTGRGLLG